MTASGSGVPGSALLRSHPASQSSSYAGPCCRWGDAAAHAGQVFRTWPHLQGIVLVPQLPHVVRLLRERLNGLLHLCKLHLPPLSADTSCCRLPLCTVCRQQSAQCSAGQRHRTCTAAAPACSAAAAWRCASAYWSHWCAHCSCPCLNPSPHPPCQSLHRQLQMEDRRGCWSLPAREILLDYLPRINRTTHAPSSRPLQWHGRGNTDTYKQQVAMRQHVRLQNGHPDDEADET